MARVRRKIIRIDEEKCDGCGLCLPACPEGALQVIDGKVKLVKESFCDGLGACLGNCPRGALSVEEKEVEEYDGEGVVAHLREKSPELLERHLRHLQEHAHELSGAPAQPAGACCPSSQMLHWDENEKEKAGEEEEGRISSELRQWPVQLHLVPPSAPYFQNADLVLVADCVPFAYANFHRDFLKGRAIAVGCPKLDDIAAYRQKLEQIIAASNPKSLTVIYMEVPCCYGFVHLAREVLAESGKDIPLETVMMGIKGELRTSEGGDKAGGKS